MPLAGGGSRSVAGANLRSMPSVFRNITVDCADAASLAVFWGRVLGWQVYSDTDPEGRVLRRRPGGAGRPLLPARRQEPDDAVHPGARTARSQEPAAPRHPADDR